MPDLDRPTESESSAETVLLHMIGSICGDSEQARWHLGYCRREVLRKGQTRFMLYLRLLASEIAVLMVDPDDRRTTFELQRQIDLAAATLKKG